MILSDYCPFFTTDIYNSLAFYPIRTFFPSNVIILGKEERLKFENDREHYGEEVQKIYDETQTYHDGKWMMFKPTDTSLYPRPPHAARPRLPLCFRNKQFPRNHYKTKYPNRSTDYERVGFDTLLAQSDILSLHCPLTDRTQNIINAQALAK